LYLLTIRPKVFFLQLFLTSYLLIMEYKFKSILLVDDDRGTNFLHEHYLKEWEVTEKIYVAMNGKEAIDFLKDTPSFGADKLSLILLDINMPVMDGFEFLEAYEQLPVELQASIIVVMLTSSLHKKDMKRAQANKSLKGFIHKPLSKEEMKKIISQIKQLEHKV